MHTFPPTLRALALLSGTFLTINLSAAPVAPFNYSNPFNKYGQTPNTTCPASPAGVCAAVAAINSFIFLQNSRPDLYGKNLVPDVDANGVATTSRDQFADTGWMVNGNPQRQGYYKRTGTANGDFIQTKMDWIEDRVPGKTTYEVRYTGAGGLPDIAWLAEQISKGQDVEFFVQGTNFYHALTLIGVSCTGADYTNCSVTYQDPNAPTGTTTTGITDNAGTLQISGVLGSTGNLNITGAFAESPIPEPMTILLTGAGFTLLLVARRRSRAY